MKKCHYCGYETNDDSNYCSNCGKQLEVENKNHETIEPEVVDRTYESDKFIKEQTILRDEFDKRANNAFAFSIISIFLCCCFITSILSLVLAITLLIDMNKMSDEIKNTTEYRKIRNKAIIAIVISSLLTGYSLITYISQLINPIDLSGSSYIKGV